MRLTAICVVVMLAQVLMVHGDCKGKCNIVYCGQSSGPRDMRYVSEVAHYLASACYQERKLRGTGTCHNKDCNLGTVFYKNDVTDKDVCAMSPFVDHETKYDCLKTAHKNQDDTVVTDNKLELCFQRANNDPGFMKTVDSECTYTVVVVARNDLTNSNITTLKYEAKKLMKENGAKIHCYVVGWGRTFDTNYYYFCDSITKIAEYRVLTYPTKKGRLIKRIYDRIKCCPGDN